MSTYVVAQIGIRDRDGYSTYEAGFLEIFAKYEGEVVAVDENVETLEGEWPFTRTVVLRFPSSDAAKQWYRSPEYQALAKHRWAAAEANIVLVQGLDAAR